MATVRELFPDLFAYVLLFEQTHLQGEFQPPYEQVRRVCTTLLEQQKAAAKRQGMPDRDYQDASFAVVAWADETILKHLTWKHHQEWNARPLQLEYFQTRNAGEEFFERLERLRPEQKEVREVYYLCLGLGFSGRYFLGLEDELKLNQLRHEQAQQLPLPLEDVQDLKTLTPQPYEVHPPTEGHITRDWTDLLWKIGLPLLIVVLVGLGLVYWFWPVPPGSPPSRPGPVEPPTPLAQKVQQWLDSHPEALQCAKVSAVEVQGRVVNLGGRVVSDAQGAEIRQGVQAVDRGIQVKTAFDTIPPPLCEVLSLLEPLQALNAAQAFGLTASLNKQGSHPVYANALYVEGENLIITIKSPARFDGYVYVDYYTADGMVGHLLPNPQEPMRLFPPNQSFTVGDLRGPRQWQILAPFGLELVTVIASKDRLFSRPRYDPESAGAYISELRQALPRDLSNAQVAATFYLITARSGQ